ncbi:response regulator transcription factor [Exilibacterium tricleocarpae]|nr:response regulator transcription factor [Exilibacterium tricleocarpae]
MKSVILRYSLLLFMLLALFKGFEYAFFSHRIALDVYLGITALSFLIIGALAVRYLWPRPGGKPHTETPEPDPALLQQFSQREQEILRLLAHGYTNKEMAAALKLSPNTIKTHLKNLYTKLQVTNRTQAAAEAKLLNLL